MSDNQRNVPALRFTSFDDEWKELSFGQLAKFKNGLNYSKENEGKGLKIIGVSDFKNFFSIKYENLSQISGFDKIDESYLLRNNDIIFVRSNGNKALVGRALFVTNINSERITHSGFTIRARIVLTSVMPILVAYLFQSEKTKQQILLESGGTNISNLSQELLSKITFHFPSLPEQQKIASFLTAIDSKIELLTKKKALLEQYKKGVMQQLFSQQIRFKDEEGNDFPEWEEKQFEEVFERITRKNKENNTNVLTISAQYGLISQIEFFNKSVAAQDLTGYYLLERGDFAYNKSYSNGYPMGAIKRLTAYPKGVVSTLYICFQIKTGYSADFYDQYFNSGFINHEIQKIAQEGARNHGLLNVSVVEFFRDITLACPSKKEQDKISGFLHSIDQKISSANQQLELAKTYKKGLLQQLFV